ncbi:50S ribosomal protein L19 [Patescibacteria group bacterium]|nr:50S ribosomal protein L19 [Patescibacteria group bacterium]MBU2220787.1 50S ribosomal protein L19 [Patescibacteria group bacterium]
MNTVITPVRTEERTQLGIRPGDTVRVHQKVAEKGKVRLQVFEGLVLAVKHGTEAGATFTVRATMSGIGVEKIFPLYSPVIDKIEIVRRSKVRRAKLYFIREKVAREVRRQLRNMRMVKLSTEDFKEEEKLEVVEEGSSVEEVVETTREESPEVVAESTEGEVTPEEVAAEEARIEEKKEQA